MKLMHWPFVLMLLGLLVIPCWRIVARTGLPGAWSLLVLVPYVNVIALWVFAYACWPRDRSALSYPVESQVGTTAP